MAVKKLVDVGITRKGGTVFCPDLATLSLVLGSRGVAGNLNVYGAKKCSNGNYSVSVAEIKKRIKELEQRKARIKRYLETMREVTK